MSRARTQREFSRGGRRANRAGILFAAAALFGAPAFEAGLALAQPPEWTEVSVSGPGERSGHAMAYDSSRDVVVLFGGRSSGDNLGDTWEWDGSTWALAATTGPSPRVSAAMVYDSDRNVALLFGGQEAYGQYFNDTWEWDGTSWTQVATTGPSTRTAAAMAYDSSRNVTVLFGGWSSYNSDTWEWNGTSWSQVLVAGPVGRYGHAMAYDTVRMVVVLFAGEIGGSGMIHDNETWEYNGVAWTLISSSGPEPRRGHRMVYDMGRNVVTMFGGWDGTAAYDDTWDWDGFAWTELAVTGPSLRVSPGLVYDRADAMTVLYGGGYDGSDLADTWEFHSAETTGTIALTPVASSGSSVLSGNEITLAGGGQQVWLEIQISGWDPDLNGTPQLQTWQLTIDSYGYTSGTLGTLVPYNPPCADTPDCEAILGPGAVCNNPQLPPMTCTPGFMDKTRPDYLFAGVSSLEAWDFATADYRTGATAYLGLPYAIDDGTVKYAATLVLDVPSDAEGTFTVRFVPSEFTMMLDAYGGRIEPPILSPAVITVAGGSCCYAYGTPGATCVDGVTPIECDSLPPPTLFTLNGACSRSLVCPECLSDASCNDLNECTYEICDVDSGTCSNPPNYHVSTECCDPSTGNITVVDDGNDCTWALCDEGTGEVAYEPAPAGTACDDGNQCTFDDICDGADPPACMGTDVSFIACAVPEDCEAVTGTAYDCDEVCICEPCLPSAPPGLDPDMPDAGYGCASRYLSFSMPLVEETQQALRVNFTDLPPEYDIPDCMNLWVGPPVERCENAGQNLPPPEGCGPAPGLASRSYWSSTLQCDPYYTDWGTYGIIRVYDESIVPNGTYEVQFIGSGCDPANDDAYSTPLELTTSGWCDVVGDCTTTPCSPPDASVDITTDVTAMLDKFKNLPGAPAKARCDVEPSEIDHLINITDVTFGVGAFTGTRYPFSPDFDPECVHPCTIQISECPTSWVPEGRAFGTARGAPGNSVTFQAVITAGGPRKIRFVLKNVSDEPGVCLNYPATPASGAESGDDKDLKFIQANNPIAEFDPPSPDGQKITTKNRVDSATVTVTSFDWGSYGQIRAWGVSDNGVICLCRTLLRDIPDDANGNHIPDFLAQDNGPGGSYAAIDDNDNDPAGDGDDGDHLSRYQEYRGFMVNGSHVRTDVTKKDVFIRNVDVANGGPSGDMTYATLGAPVHAIKAPDWNAQREINFNHDTAGLGTTQTAIKVENRALGGDLGQTTCYDPCVPNTLVSCYVDVAEIQGSGTTLAKNITQDATTIPVPGTAHYWSSDHYTGFVMGAFRIGGEAITYAGVTATSFTGCTRGTTPSGHPATTPVSNFADAPSCIKNVLAHEAGHVVNLADYYSSGPANWPQHIMAGVTFPGARDGDGYTSTTYGTTPMTKFRVKP